MKYIKRFEANFKNNITLYHGTCEHNANELLKNGWSPNQIGQGGNMGQPLRNQKMHCGLQKKRVVIQY